MKKQIVIDRKTKKVLDNSLILLSKGHSVRYCLSKYKKYRDVSESYLAILERLKNIIPVKPDDDYLKNSLERIYSKSESEIEDYAGEIDEVEKVESVNGGRRRLILKPAIVFLAVFTFFIFSFAGTIYASQDSIPGKALYPVKRSVEKVKLYVYPDSRMGPLHLQLLNNRLYEADILIDSDFEDVEIIEGLIIEIENEFLQCKKYDFFGSNTEVEIENIIDDIKKRYQTKFGQIEIEEEDTTEIDNNINDKDEGKYIYDYYDMGSYKKDYSEKDSKIDEDGYIDDSINGENGNGIIYDDSDEVDEDEYGNGYEEELEGDDEGAGDGNGDENGDDDGDDDGEEDGDGDGDGDGDSNNDNDENGEEN